MLFFKAEGNAVIIFTPVKVLFALHDYFNVPSDADEIDSRKILGSRGRPLPRRKKAKMSLFKAPVKPVE
ncbi:MAG TPA: hypothetical protein DEH07_11170 [Desulfotomaculum sp.]|nr:hypothetical protein [Desulfotomaculum sp.]